MKNNAFLPLNAGRTLLLPLLLTACSLDLDSVSSISSNEEATLAGAQTENALPETDQGILERAVSLPDITAPSAF